MPKQNQVRLAGQVNAADRLLLRQTDLDDTSLHTADWHSSNASNLVDVLQGQAQGLVAGPLGGLNQVQGLQQNGSLVPVHVCGALNHVVALETGDGHKVDLQKKPRR